MTIERIESHLHEALVKLIPGFWGKPVIAALLRSYINRVQEFEDDVFEVMGAFHIDTCDEARLAILGKIVGQPNAGWSTETYRAVVRAKIAANRSHGREDDVVNVIRLALSAPTRADREVTVTTHTNASMTVELGGDPLDADAIEALDFLLPRTRAAGVQLHLILATDDPGLIWASSVSGGGGDLGSSVSGGGDAAASVHLL